LISSKRIIWQLKLQTKKLKTPIKKEKTKSYKLEQLTVIFKMSNRRLIKTLTSLMLLNIINNSFSVFKKEKMQNGVNNWNKKEKENWQRLETSGSKQLNTLACWTKTNFPKLLLNLLINQAPQAQLVEDQDKIDRRQMKN